MKKYDIAVFGCGFVGSTTADWLEEQGHNITRVDPKLYPDVDPLQAVLDCSHIIICVPTPGDYDTIMAHKGQVDDRAIKDIINICDYRHKILVKSTITPDCVNNYPANVCVSPEFLRANSAREDFENSEVLVVGHFHNTEDHADEWIEMFSALGAPVTKCSRETACMIKYTHNAWLATKVAFFHEMLDCTSKMTNFNYSDMTATLARMKNIGPSHMIAPNQDGSLGFGGHCFPKDMLALTKVINHRIINKVYDVNKTLNKRRTL